MKMKSCDVLCVGGGAAGIFAAITAAISGVKVCLISKELLGCGNTRISGGIFSHPGVVKEDSCEKFYEDIIAAGEYINNRKLAAALASEADKLNIEFEKLGHLFNRDINGELVNMKRGGHSCSRIVTSSYRGLSISHTLKAAVARYNLEVLEWVTVLELLTVENAVAGALCLDITEGEYIQIEAKKTILATGGLGSLYFPHTDNMKAATGDGYELAFSAGARLVDMEHIQWMPFSVCFPESMAGISCGEPAIAGPLGVIRNKFGEIVVNNVNQLTRSEVTKFIAKEMYNGGACEHGGLIFDPTQNHNNPEGKKIHEYFKKMGNLDPVRHAYGQKAFEWKEPYEVAPTQHFCCGGVEIDENGATGVQNLYAIGEVAGGVHGADRLGSVALSECIVFGKRAALDAVSHLKTKEKDHLQVNSTVKDFEVEFDQKASLTASSIKNEIGQIMWEHVGCIRDQEGMYAALNKLNLLKAKIKKVKVLPYKRWNTSYLDFIESRKMLKIAEIVTKSSIERKESRGNHIRFDFLDKLAEWQNKNIFAKKGDNGEVIIEVLRRQK